VAECLQALGVTVDEENSVFFLLTLLPDYKKHLEMEELHAYSIHCATVWRSQINPTTSVLFVSFLEVINDVWELLHETSRNTFRKYCNSLSVTRLSTWLREEKRECILLLSLFVKDIEAFSRFLCDRVGYNCDFAAREFTNSVAGVTFAHA
jgi:hypothetical protein